MKNKTNIMMFKVKILNYKNKTKVQLCKFNLFSKNTICKIINNIYIKREIKKYNS